MINQLQETIDDAKKMYEEKPSQSALANPVEEDTIKIANQLDIRLKNLEELMKDKNRDDDWFKRLDFLSKEIKAIRK